MVSRIEAPTLQLAQQMIDLALKAEREGLKGKAYFDGRGFKLGTGYQMVNDNIEKASQRVKKEDGTSG